MTLRKRYSDYLAQGMSRERAKKVAWLDYLYGEEIDDWEDYESRPPAFGPHPSFHTANCRHCGATVAREEVVLQTFYWTPNHFVLFHKDCVSEYQKEVYELQMIDKDCNECRSFSSKQPTIMGNRRGNCAKFDREVVAYPGGTFCSYPDHEECFDHRKPLLC